MERTERPFTAKEVSSILDIADSTLRKWCLAIEEQEYFFTRTDSNKRLFYKQDMELLKVFRKLVKVQNMSLENATMLVIAKVKEGVFGKQDNENSISKMRSSDEVLEKLMNHIEQQEQFNNALLKRLDEQQTYIDNRLEQRDQLLIESLKQSMEAQKQIAAAQEDQKEHKSFWQRLFNK